MRLKIVLGLGNPGPEYDASRHNVGWWVVDRLAYDWGFDSFERDGRAFLTEGDVGESRVKLVKPATYMNRSGLAMRPLKAMEDFNASEDLLVIVDDAALDVGSGAVSARGRGRWPQRIEIDIGCFAVE